MEDRVHLPGFLPDPHRYLGLFDILALSSKSEQFPISVVEGMAAALPIAAPQVGDILEMVSDENRPFITVKANEVALRDSLQALAGCTPAQRAYVGAKNRARAIAEYDESVMIDQYVTLYEAAMCRPGSLR